MPPSRSKLSQQHSGAASRRVTGALVVWAVLAADNGRVGASVIMNFKQAIFDGVKPLVPYVVDDYYDTMPVLLSVGFRQLLAPFFCSGPE